MNSNRITDDVENNNQVAPARLIGNATLASSVKALLIKRFHLYKRDKTAICCEVVVPFVCVLIGCIINNINFSQKSFTIQVDPDLYPSPQRILMNDQPVKHFGIDSYTTEELYGNLPGTFGSDGNWDTQYNSSGLVSVKYYTNVYNLSLTGNPEPYRFGSYEVFKADKTNNDYQFATMLNLTSPMVAAYYPQYMYESLLKTKAGVTLNQ